MGLRGEAAIPLLAPCFDLDAVVMHPRALTTLDDHQALDFLLSRIDYERIVPTPYGQREFKLDRMRALLAAIGNPQDAYPIVHIAGTKGKGSTAVMLASVLTASRRRTGLFSSPHLWRVEERIAVDRVPCSSAQFAGLIRRLAPHVAELDQHAAAETPAEGGPTYFEILTAAALLHFAEQRVDAAVLEVGLGGRLDSTNVCAPELTIITSISFDHMRQLGATLAQIATEKAGIIKPGVPLISGVVGHEPRDVIRQISTERGAPVWELEREFAYDYRPPAVGWESGTQEMAAPASFDFRWLGPSGASETSPGNPRLAPAMGPATTWPLPLLGRHQAANAALVLAAVAWLRLRGWQISDESLRAGLRAVRWPARLEVVRRSPTIVLDAAHNVASVEALLAALQESFPQRPRHLVFATTKEKEIAGMLRLLLPWFDSVVLTRYCSNPRGVPVEELAATVASLDNRTVMLAESPQAACQLVRRNLVGDDLIVVTGSFFIAAEMRTAIDRAPW